MLRRPVHELEWGPGGRLSLQVTALPADGDPAQVRRAQVRRARCRPGRGETAGDRSLLVPLQDAGPAGGTEAPGRSCGRSGGGAPGLARRWPGEPGRSSGDGEGSGAACSAGPGERRSSGFIPLPSSPSLPESQTRCNSSGAALELRSRRHTDRPCYHG